MAFISMVKKTGKFRVCFSLDGVSQRSFMLPTGDKKKAQTVCNYVDRILEQRKTGEPDSILANWLAELTPDLRRRLEKAELLEAKQKPKTIQDIIDWFKNRDVEPSTLLTYKKVANNLNEFFSADCLLETIDPEQAARFYDWLKKHYAEATAKRRINLTKQFFAEAVRLNWIIKSPFRFCKGGDVVNKKRWQYLTADEITKALDKIPNKEHRAQVALMRFGGVRGSSEMYQMDWTPATIQWSAGNERGNITILAEKTKKYEGKENRIVPLHPVLEACLRDLFDATPEGQLKMFPKMRKTSNPGTWLKRALSFAKVNIIRVYNLRDSFCNDVMESVGGDAKAYEALTGHSFQMGLKHYQQYHKSRKEKAEGLLIDFWKVQEAAETSDAGNAGINEKEVAGFAAEQNAKQPGKQAVNSAEKVAGKVAGQGGESIGNDRNGEGQENANDPENQDVLRIVSNTYGKMQNVQEIKKWAKLDSNQRHLPGKGSALTN